MPTVLQGPVIKRRTLSGVNNYSCRTIRTKANKFFFACSSLLVKFLPVKTTEPVLHLSTIFACRGRSARQTVCSGQVRPRGKSGTHTRRPNIERTSAHFFRCASNGFPKKTFLAKSGPIHFVGPPTAASYRDRQSIGVCRCMLISVCL